MRRTLAFPAAALAAALLPHCSRTAEEAPAATGWSTVHSAVVSHGRIYLVGGRDTSYHEPGNFTAFFDRVVPEVDVYDFAAGQWATLPARLPVGTAAGGLVAKDRSIYYFGGETSQDLAHAETQRLDLDTGEWSMLAPLVRGRHGGGAVSLDGAIYFAAGSGGRGGGPELSSTEVFRP